MTPKSGRGWAAVDALYDRDDPVPPVLEQAFTLFMFAAAVERDQLVRIWTDRGHLFGHYGDISRGQPIAPGVAATISTELAEAKHNLTMKGGDLGVRLRAINAALAVFIHHKIDPVVVRDVLPLITRSGIPVTLTVAALVAGMTVEEFDHAIQMGEWPTPETLATMTALRR